MDRLHLFFCLFLVAFCCSCSNNVTSTAGAPNVSVVSVVANTFQYSSTNPYFRSTGTSPFVGQKMIATVSFENTGMPSFPEKGYSYSVYLSKDSSLSRDEDVLLLSEALDVSKVGKADSSWNSYLPFIIPGDTVPGSYYLFFVANPDKTTEETSYDDNTKMTGPFEVRKFESVGAFKVYNSWGSNWEDGITGGYYYLPFEKLIDLGAEAYLYDNSQAEAYKPTILAKFKINCQYPIQYFTTKFSTSAGSVTIPFVLSDDNRERLPYASFPDYELTYDLTDLYADLKGSGGTVTLTVNPVASSWYEPTVTAFSILIDGNTFSSADVGNASATVVLDSAALAGIGTPVVRSSKGGMTGDGSYSTRALTEAEKMALHESFPDSSVLVNGHGTGLVRANAISAYDSLRKVIPTGKAMASPASMDFSSYDDKVDLSVKDSEGNCYFPPSGNQGSVGSCAAFSSAYYIMTYEMAKEHGWTDVSAATWDAEAMKPTSATDHIMSPAYVYHMANGGQGGMGSSTAFQVLSGAGCCSWESMGHDDVYDPDPSTGQKKAYTMPSASAFEEAASYRISDPPATAVLTIANSADIETLMQYLLNGHCVMLVLDSSNLYYLFNQKGVMVGNSTGLTDSNHAQTIVGYLKGDGYQLLLK